MERKFYAFVHLSHNLCQKNKGQLLYKSNNVFLLLHDEKPSGNLSKQKGYDSGNCHFGACQGFKSLLPKCTSAEMVYERLKSMGVCPGSICTADSCGTSHVLVIWPASLCFAEDLSDIIRCYGFAQIILQLGVGKRSGSWRRRGCCEILQWYHLLL